MLQLERQQDLINLAHVVFVLRQVDVAGHLHRDSRGTLALGAPQVGQRRAHEAPVRHTAVLVKVSVFNRQHSVDHHLGDLLDRGEFAPLFAVFANQDVIRREHPQRQNRSVVRQIRNVRQVGKSHRQCNGNHHQQAKKTGSGDTQRPKNAFHQRTAQAAGVAVGVWPVAGI